MGSYSAQCTEKHVSFPVLLKPTPGWEVTPLGHVTGVAKESESNHDLEKP